MKRILAALALALAAVASFGATQYPLSLLSPTGSTSGQLVTSTGPTTPPVWSTVSLATLGGLSPATAASTYATIAQATTALAATGGSINGVTVGLTTPAAGKVTTLVATSTITPSSTAGIVGTTTNDSAQAGSVGESVIGSATAVSLTTATNANITSISLTAGDWEVSGLIQFLPAAGTTTSGIVAGVSTATANFMNVPGTSVTNVTALNSAVPATQQTAVPAPTTRISIATTTTVYLVGQAQFATSTMTANGVIRARRAR